MLGYLYGRRFVSKIRYFRDKPTYEDGTQGVPKRRNIEFRRRGITQKQAYTIRTKAKV